ncbi:MAG: dioxygenase, partial [Candidatus Thorarchaeota archaeon]
MSDSTYSPTGPLMPALFVGHGSPMNAIEANEFSKNWSELARSIPTPSAILCVSAHWVTSGTEVTASPSPETIHDFYGFPPALYGLSYPAPGSPSIAERVKEIVTSKQVQLHNTRGLDHGTWVVLRRMYPDANIPTLQLSLANDITPREHYELAKE